MSLDRMRKEVRKHFRFNGVRWVILFGSLALAYLCVRGGVKASAGSFEASLFLILAGAALTATGKTVLDLATRSEAYRQGAYTERAKAVQEVLREARGLKSAWFAHLVGRLETVETGKRVEEELQDPGEVVDVLASALLRATWDNRVWIGTSGENAVREYIEGLKGVSENHSVGVSTDECRRLESGIASPFGDLERRLVGDLGYTPE